MIAFLFNTCVTQGVNPTCFATRISLASIALVGIVWLQRWNMMTSSNGNIFAVTGPLCGIHRSPVNSPHKGQWRGALMFSLICDRINGWVNNGEAGDLRGHRAHYNVTVINLAICYLSHGIINLGNHGLWTLYKVMAWCCQVTSQNQS